MADTVILGAGIIGVSTAYYLSKHQPGTTIHLVEPSPELFASASGYAGGFLARDWFGTGVASLAALSFDEHKRLAELHDGASKWGYSRSTSLSYTAASQTRGRKSQRGEDWLRYGTSRADAAAGCASDGFDGRSVLPPWLRREDGDSVRPIGDDRTTAQVDPFQLCHFLLRQCLDRGVHLSQPARAIAIMKDVRDELSSIRIADTHSSTETDVPCTRLIITAGAWSPQVFKEVSSREIVFLFSRNMLLPLLAVLQLALVVCAALPGLQVQHQATSRQFGVFITPATSSPQNPPEADSILWIAVPQITERIAHL